MTDTKILTEKIQAIFSNIKEAGKYDFSSDERKAIDQLLELVRAEKEKERALVVEEVKALIEKQADKHARVGVLGYDFVHRLTGRDTNSGLLDSLKQPHTSSQRENKE